MSRLRADNLTNRAGTGAPHAENGLVVTGVVTSTSLDADATGLAGTPDITVRNITGTAATFSGNVSVGGTLTFEDVAHLDSVGIATARIGLKVLAGGVDITSGGLVVSAGISTIAERINVGSGTLANIGLAAYNDSTTASQPTLYAENDQTSGNLFLGYGAGALKATITGTGAATFAGTVSDALGDVRSIPLRAVSGSSASIGPADAGKVVLTDTTGWTISASGSWVGGDIVTLLNNSAGGLTITCSAVTTYLTSDGSTVTSQTLGARGMATLYFTSSTVCYLQGTALS